ncbi:MAG TPA: hypothetical protein VF624_16730 [Tepidisphaeraceae bacterium]|jgi:hypothetical protein
MIRKLLYLVPLLLWGCVNPGGYEPDDGIGRGDERVGNYDFGDRDPSPPGEAVYDNPDGVVDLGDGPVAGVYETSPRYTYDTAGYDYSVERRYYDSGPYYSGSYLYNRYPYYYHGGRSYRHTRPDVDYRRDRDDRSDRGDRNTGDARSRDRDQQPRLEDAQRRQERERTERSVPDVSRSDATRTRTANDDVARQRNRDPGRIDTTPPRPRGDTGNTRSAAPAPTAPPVPRREAPAARSESRGSAAPARGGSSAESAGPRNRGSDASPAPRSGGGTDRSGASRSSGASGGGSTSSSRSRTR